jgi:hypothetical protein
MSRRQDQAQKALRRARSTAAGVLIGSAVTTPAFAAATDFVLDDFQWPPNDLQLAILIGSLVLLVIALSVKAVQRRRGAANPKPAGPPPGFSEGIGRYRLQLGRGDAY